MPSIFALALDPFPGLALTGVVALALRVVYHLVSAPSLAFCWVLVFVLGHALILAPTPAFWVCVPVLSLAVQLCVQFLAHV